MCAKLYNSELGVILSLVLIYMNFLSWKVEKNRKKYRNTRFDMWKAELLVSCALQKDDGGVT